MKLSSTKYIFVTGGVTSSLGKGIVSASLAKLLQSRGLSVTIQKLDPYINVDPGTLNPYEHGECYVTDDGARQRIRCGTSGCASKTTWFKTFGKTRFIRFLSCTTCVSLQP